MMAERWDSGTKEMAVARQLCGEHFCITNTHIFYAVHAKAM
jgi:hypothetical protein